ncbi:hypothetical protein [Streptomyces sp. NBC_00078]|uniref:hypothetical protein n=1 Tax=unclassified Streptomyces TaxID=2593676 RepID=UPI0022563957|nr:hypothetical protein [Streptomyces sp. NBC_00078]MCX5418159.1 hypothetical protein [Streptomyces sp. NBC_00078]
MIPTNWIRHHRPQDNELLGYLCPVNGTPVQFIPVTVFGYPLAAPTDQDQARHVLQSTGLSCLAEPWLLTVPDRAEPVTVQIIEATPRRLRVRNTDYGYQGASFGEVIILAVPDTDRLQRG